jgi:hypothetical protein
MLNKLYDYDDYPDVIIPTCKPEVNAQAEELRKGSTNFFSKLITTCQQASASRNRNHGLMKSEAELVIMLDDDITGFYNDWYMDFIMGWDDSYAMMSARLLEPSGRLAYMLSENEDMSHGNIVVEKKELPTSCVMFRNDGTRFDNQFIGSGFEDNDFCKQLAIKYPDKKFVINNECRLIHINEKKNQSGGYWNHNKLYFNNKWGENR